MESKIKADTWYELKVSISKRRMERLGWHTTTLYAHRRFNLQEENGKTNYGSANSSAGDYVSISKRRMERGITEYLDADLDVVSISKRRMESPNFWNLFRRSLSFNLQEENGKTATATATASTSATAFQSPRGEWKGSIFSLFTTLQRVSISKRRMERGITEYLDADLDVVSISKRRMERL